MEAGPSLEQRRAEVFRSFAKIFLDLPSKEFAQSILDGKYLAEATLDSLRDIVPEQEAVAAPDEVDAATLLREGLADIERFATVSREKPLETVHTDISVERTRLVRGIARGYGPPPPYGMTWKTPSPESMGKLEKAYNQLSYTPPNRENATYIGVETDFLSVISDKIGQEKLEGQDTSSLETLRDDFLREQYLPWVPQYCQAVIRDSKLEFFTGIAKLLLASLRTFGGVSQVAPLE